MLKVLFITNIPVPYRINFYNELGNKVDLTVIFEAKGASDQGIRFNYDLSKIKNFRAIFLSEGNIREKNVDWSIFKYINNKYDRIVLTSYSYYTEMIILIYFKIIKKSYFLSSDGGIIKYGESALKKYYKKYLVSGAKGYLSPSKKSDEYLEYYGADNKHIYRYPFTSLMSSERISKINTNEEKDSIKKQLGFQEKYIILGIGQFIHRKGWDVLLKAMKGIANNIALCIIGGKITEEYIQIQEKLELNHVYFFDFMGKAELDRYYNAADIFVLPTREDIWGLVINEAMNYGLPVISTNACISGIELIHENENGYIVNDIDSDSAPDQLKKYILDLLADDSKRYSFAKKSLQIIKQYSIEKTSDAYFHAFMEEKDD